MKLPDNYEFIISEVDKLSITDQLNLLEYLYNIYKLTNISDYAHESGLSRQTIYNRIEAETLPSIVLNKTTYILKSIT